MNEKLMWDCPLLSERVFFYLGCNFHIGVRLYMRLRLILTVGLFDPYLLHRTIGFGLPVASGCGIFAVVAANCLR
jgi:hypothetical protein